MNSILDKIAEQKRIEVARAKQTAPLSSLHTARSDSRDFVAALQTHSPAIIAEIKKASPSKGIIREDFDVVEIAKIYAAAGACCLSVLTDEHFFLGHPDYIQLAKQNTQLPVLRKDFIIDSYQINESVSLNADCILLIVAMLDDQQLHDFCQQAMELGLAVLVESHTQHELDRALKLPTPLMGINNRSLHTFSTDIQTTFDLAKNIPHDKLIISESGIHTREDVVCMMDHNIHAFLIGESLMRAENIGEKLQGLLGC